MPSSPPENAAATWGNACTETSPLLQNPDLATAPNCAQTDEDCAERRENIVDESCRLTTSWQLEAKTITMWSAPLIVTHLLQRSISVSSVFAVGRIGPTELGAVSLASITAGLIGNSLIQGLATSLDTLAAQAYGSGNHHLVGLHMQRMICFILPCVVPLMILWWKADELLVLVLQDRRLAELTGVYLKIMCFRMPAFVLFECGKRFVQAQGIFNATPCVLLVAAPFNALTMWLLVWRLDWGFVGAPIAIAITENLMPVLLVVYVLLVDGSQCWGGFTRKTFSNWGPMMRLALPGMMMHVAEFAVEEILTMVSARFGTAHLAAQSALVTIVTLTYNIPLAVSVAASNRVANWIGAQATGPAKTAAKVTVVLGLIISSFIMVTLFSLRHQIPRLFTRDAEVKEILVSVLPLVICMQVFDAFSVLSHGLLRGIGSQDVGGYVNLVVYYVVALPTSLVTAFPLDWKLHGLWTGVTTGLCM
ncbi:hypothetical protein HIM_08465 [Hirsutella minnesotensis 3608]|uniref:Uncharacterized protein n=1 Tax=Hirsutella minnesotensis 3608 TaxID=1043627 RepID=A0A0F7ZML3_9HYPO|nr:hypothetical protein HIM_08465 [Hirsutella minnesotensis 3608]